MTKKPSRLVFSPTSLTDLQRINEFYLRISPKVRTQAINRLTESFKLIEKYPDIGRAYAKHKVQEFIVPFGKGNFFIRYQQEKKKIHVAHIWHSLEDES